MTDFDFIQCRLTVSDATDLVFEFGKNSFQFLAGTSNIMTAIWADLNAGREVGKVYITSYGEGAAFSIVNLNTKILYDSYTLTVKGRAGVTLEQEDIKDINIGE